MIKSPELSASASWLARLSRSFIPQNDICICFANKESGRTAMDWRRGLPRFSRSKIQHRSVLTGFSAWMYQTI
jgi:hypothetical protein